MLLQLLEEEPELLQIVRLHVVHALLGVKVDTHLRVVRGYHGLANVELASTTTYIDVTHLQA